MATGGLYGNASESVGLYGNTTSFGGSYFEWFIFIQAETQPATPTGGSWSFTTNSGTPPTGWSSTPPSAPTLPVWVSIALVNSRNEAALVWSAPGLFSYSSGLPILSGTGSPSAGDGITGQLWIETGTTPETIWFKQAGTWTRLTGSTLYVDLTSSQTIAGTKTFSNQIQGSVSGTSANVTGIVAIANGGTNSNTALGGLTNLGGIGSLTSTDGTITITSPTATSRDLSATATTNVVCQVRNTTGATLTKGTVVYISGATGQLPTVSKALATSDATSAQTLGMISADLANNSNGNVTVIGLITNIDTSAYTDGQQLYLSGTTAGTVTATKPYAPIHLVYVAVVEHAHPTQGKLFVKVQNGYELDELHNVSAQFPSNGQTIVYNSSNSLWENNTVSLAIGVNGTLPIANGGTGQTTANAAFNALAPSQTGNSGKYLTTDGSNTSWASNPLGTVTSVAATVPSFLSISGSPITTSGTLAFSLSGTALPTTSGGTGLTSFTSGGVIYASSSSALTSGSALTFDGTTLTATTQMAAGTTGTAGKYLLNRASDGAAAVSLGLSSNDFSANNGAGGGYIFNISSAEQMRLTSTGLGIGTSSPAQKLEVNTTSGSYQMRLGSGTTATAYTYDIGRSSVDGYFRFYGNQTGANGYIFGGIDGTRLIIDTSGNVGIGTSSPGGLLQVGVPNTSTGSLRAYSSYVIIDAGYQSSNVSGTAATPSLVWAGDDNTGIWHPASDTLAISTAGTERMRLDSSGNLGLGVTPSAWGSDFKVFQLANGASISSDSSPIIHTTMNGYYDGSNWRRIATNSASNYYQYNGQHIWRTTASDSANSIISWTQAMTLAASGGLSVGTTTDAGAGNILVNGLGTFTATSANGARALKLIGRPTTNDAQIGFFANDGTTSQGFFNSSASKVAFFTASSLESVIFLADGRLRTYSTISVGDANPSTSGAGITFPATQSASSDANTLDDYEEGTWTATLSATGGGSVTLTSDAKYIKVGNLVFISIENYAVSISGLSTGNLIITGLPFSVSGYSPAIAYFQIAGAVTASQGAVVAYGGGAAMYLYLSESTAPNINNLTKADLNSSISLRFNGTYTV